MAAGRHLGFGLTENSAIRSADPENHTRTKREVDRMTCYGDIADYSLHMRIFAIFLLLAEVLVTDSESHTLFPIHICVYGSIRLSFRDTGMGQTDDRRTTPLINVFHLLLQADHLIKVVTIKEHAKRLFDS